MRYLLLALCSLLVAAGCQSGHSTKPVVDHVYTIDTSYQGAALPSVAERVYLSDAVVRASLVSTGDGVLNFRATEYLKGSGPNTFSLPIGSGDRDTQWDGQEAILFLSAEDTGGAGGTSGNSSDGFTFTDTTTWPWYGAPQLMGTYTGTLPEGYTIGSNNPVWLPDVGSGGASGSSSAKSSPNFETGAEDSSISLDDLKETINWLQSRPTVADYDDCILASLHYDREARDKHAYYGDWRVDKTWNKRLASGTPAGATIETTPWGDHTRYAENTLSGRDAEHFEVYLMDDDKLSTNLYHIIIRTTRPLPEGTYKFRSNSRLPWYIPCNYNPYRSYLDYTVTTESPEGVVHEAFFDPVSSGDAVGYFGTGDALKPAAVSTGDISTTIQSLKWQDSAVTLGLQPYNALTGQVLDFITGDGTTTLSLQGAAATGDSTSGTLTWAVGSQPWSSGDELMLRLRESQTMPSFRRDSYTFSVPENTDAWESIGTVLATDLDGDAVLHKITSGSDGGRFAIDGWEGLILLLRELDYETRTSYELTITGTDPGGRSDSTTVTIEVTDVAE